MSANTRSSKTRAAVAVNHFPRLMFDIDKADELCRSMFALASILKVLWGHGCVVLEIEHRSDNMKALALHRQHVDMC